MLGKRAVDKLLIPAMLLAILAIGSFSGVEVYEAFVAGAKQGLSTCIKVLPYLCGALLLVGVMQGSGALGALTQLLSPVLSFSGIPQDTGLLLIVRPFSGAAALGALSDIFARLGPDSEAGRVAAVMLGSTETVLYTVSIYLGARSIRLSRYTIPIALITSLVSAIAAAWLCRIL